jgi:FlaA1/EpsC-like NDP-sugar epimerase
MDGRVLITGGAGSIGSEVARALVGGGTRVRILDTNEEGLWRIHAELPVEVMLGDVQAWQDVERAAIEVDAIVHCAAYKHVTFCEDNYIAARRVNVYGTENVVAAACLRRIVYVSTDKAIHPTCVMGRTKARGEEIALKADNANVVRFGNVLGSRGSLLPAILRYSRLGRAIPMTDPDMTRFFMPVHEAVSLIMQALRSTKAGKMFSPPRPRSARIGEFLEVTRRMLAPLTKIVQIGARDGERQHEYLELPDGEIVCSDDPRFLMDSDEMARLISEACSTPQMLDLLA